MADAVQPVSHGGHAAHDGHDLDEAHAHSPFLQHHFDNPVQQFDATKLGMWLFLATEILLFGGLFCAYAVYRANHPEIFIEGHHYLDKTMGAVNTVILLVSSFTMAWGVRAAQKNQQTLLKILLSLTLLGGAGFLVIKYIEYSHKVHDGLLWGHYFKPVKHDAGGATGDHGAASAKERAPAGGAIPAGEAKPATDGGHTSSAAQPPVEKAGAAAPAPPPAAAGGTTEKLGWDFKAPGRIENTTIPMRLDVADVTDPGVYDKAHDVDMLAHNVHIFFGIYFCMTGLHGLHVIAGMSVIAWLLYGAFKGRFSSEYFTPVDLGGLYWHLVDLIWIYLFPLLYLIH